MKKLLSSVFVASTLLAAMPTQAAETWSYQEIADSLQMVIAADREVYTKLIVNRLQNQEKVIKASEHWKDDKALVLPAQMLRHGAEIVAENKAKFSYALLSQWPINKQNAPKTDAEKAGLDTVAKTGKPYYKEETLGGKKYFTAMYPDKAVAKACISCHNDHKDSPRNDFKMKEIMGSLVIRIPMK